MTADVHSRERREVLLAARRYRRDGYKVIGPDEWDKKPGFLGDFVPDLVAERDDDKVVIEVKEAPSVRGSNEIVELAEVVSAQPGWRFELIAIPAETSDPMPNLSWIGAEIQQLLDKGFLKAAFVSVYAMIENLVSYAASWPRKPYAGSAVPVLVRDLVAHGIIDEETRRKIDEARVRRNIILNDPDEAAALKRSDVEALLRVGYDLKRDILAIIGT